VRQEAKSAVAEMGSEDEEDYRHDGSGIGWEEIRNKNQCYLQNQILHHSPTVKRSKGLVSEKVEIEK
jgi:hypothetical protein